MSKGLFLFIPLLLFLFITILPLLTFSSCSRPEMLDIIWMIDMSGNQIEPPPFSDLTTFIANFSSTLPSFSPSTIRSAFVGYAGDRTEEGNNFYTINQVSYLNNSNATSQSNFINSILSLESKFGPSDQAKAIDFVRQHMLTNQDNRVGSKRIVVMLADGAPVGNSESLVEIAVDKIREEDGAWFVFVKIDIVDQNQFANGYLDVQANQVYPTTIETLPLLVSTFLCLPISNAPTSEPTMSPTFISNSPTTHLPSFLPTTLPTRKPTKSPTLPTSFPSKSPTCLRQDPVDIVWVISGGFAVSDAPGEFENTTAFITKVTKLYTLGNSNTRVGLLVYAGTSFENPELKTIVHTINLTNAEAIDKLLFQQKIASFNASGGTSDMKGAFDFVRNEMFTPANLRSNGAKRLVVFIARSLPSDQFGALHSNLVDEANLAISNLIEEDQVTFVLVRIGNTLRSGNLGNMSSIVYDLDDSNFDNVIDTEQFLCFQFSETPTLGPTSPAPSISPTSICPSQPTMLDIVWMLDMSGNTKNIEFAFENIAALAGNFALMHNIGPNAIRMGYVGFAGDHVNQPGQFFTINQISYLTDTSVSTSKTTFFNAVTSLDALGGTTMQGEAIDFVREEMFTPENYRGPLSKRIVVMVTDSGPSNNQGNKELVDIAKAETAVDLIKQEDEAFFVLVKVVYDLNAQSQFPLNFLVGHADVIYEALFDKMHLIPNFLCFPFSSEQPTHSPIIPQPTKSPTVSPPTYSPTISPTKSPIISPTKSPIIAPIIVPTKSPICYNSQADILWMIDGSSWVSEETFNGFRDFVADFTLAAEMSNSLIRQSYLHFSGQFQDPDTFEFNENFPLVNSFSNFSNPSSTNRDLFYNEVSNLVKRGGSTNLAGAFDFVRTDMFVDNEKRSGIQRIVILIMGSFVSDFFGEAMSTVPAQIALQTLKEEDGIVLVIVQAFDLFMEGFQPPVADQFYSVPDYTFLHDLLLGPFLCHLNNAPTFSPPTVALPTKSPIAPSPLPTFRPSSMPTKSPTFKPSPFPTQSPTFPTTHVPTMLPTFPTTMSPTTLSPSQSPTLSTFGPTHSPTNPTRSPTNSTSTNPTVSPTLRPTTLAPVSPTFTTGLPSRAPSHFAINAQDQANWLLFRRSFPDNTFCPANDSVSACNSCPSEDSERFITCEAAQNTQIVGRRRRRLELQELRIVKIRIRNSNLVRSSLPTLAFPNLRELDLSNDPCGSNFNQISSSPSSCTAPLICSFHMIPETCTSANTGSGNTGNVLPVYVIGIIIALLILLCLLLFCCWRRRQKEKPQPKGEKMKQQDEEDLEALSKPTSDGEVFSTTINDNLVKIHERRSTKEFTAIPHSQYVDDDDRFLAAEAAAEAAAANPVVALSESEWTKVKDAESDTEFWINKVSGEYSFANPEESRPGDAQIEEEEEQTPSSQAHSQFPPPQIPRTSLKTTYPKESQGYSRIGNLLRSKSMSKKELAPDELQDDSPDNAVNPLFSQGNVDEMERQQEEQMQLEQETQRRASSKFRFRNKSKTVSFSAAATDDSNQDDDLSAAAINPMFEEGLVNELNEPRDTSSTTVPSRKKSTRHEHQQQDQEDQQQWT